MMTGSHKSMVLIPTIPTRYVVVRLAVVGSSQGAHGNQLMLADVQVFAQPRPSPSPPSPSPLPSPPSIQSEAPVLPAPVSPASNLQPLGMGLLVVGALLQLLILITVKCTGKGMRCGRRPVQPSVPQEHLDRELASPTPLTDERTTATKMDSAPLPGGEGGSCQRVGHGQGLGGTRGQDGGADVGLTQEGLQGLYETAEEDGPAGSSQPNSQPTGSDKGSARWATRRARTRPGYVKAEDEEFDLADAGKEQGWL